ncbi:DUF2264 domain-containing protein [Sphingobacterium sp. N143]|mgnify:CR=1 FL=1|uniref:DUF2264 domain-containing protein n=1 Tax=Sphingobacterium sp. N143 TaxID=2746727 RepID=UPI0025785D7F|nr:DUF2264 domain-containing protein [Sphingobacterium sp. N143]MDM1292722.1 DUF2264 domain-containing protein [Sphingobacterium sp. N143]
MKYIRLLACVAVLFCGEIALPAWAQQRTAVEAIQKQATGDRKYWSDLLYQITSPVIHNLAAGTLKKNMPLEKAPGYMLKAEQVSYLEAVGRTMAGVAPWLALPDDDTEEGKQRDELRRALLKGIANAVDPKNPDCLDFSREQQPIVDAAFMAQGFLRAPEALWAPLDKETKTRIVANFKSLRNRSAYYNNWLLFSALTEAFLLYVGEDADPMRIEIALKKMDEWYLGDGWYSDGPHFAMDYYNSYVIQPMLVDLYRVLSGAKRINSKDYELAVKRMQRYATFQERMIGTDGSFPPFGRSITYRTGAFQALAQVALMGKYPEGISPGQLRSAMTAMHKRTFNACSNFDDKGWLVLGFCGSQPEVADTYTSTGSLYMTSLSFLPLGLPADDPFWTSESEDWTSKKAWQGQAFKKDYKVGY